jgi:formyl-CoA transferase
VRNRALLVPLVRSLVREHTRDTWLRRLNAAGVPCGAIRSVGEVCEGEALGARAMVAHMPHASAGVVKAIKNPMHLSETPLAHYAAPPTLGEHTREILARVLGLSAAEIDDLERSKAV